jgi:hypothetical protein
MPIHKNPLDHIINLSYVSFTFFLYRTSLSVNPFKLTQSKYNMKRKHYFLTDVTKLTSKHGKATLKVPNQAPTHKVTPGRHLLRHRIVIE